MSSFTFEPESRPFPRWMGPFSPARGTTTGFRFEDGRLGTWVATESEWVFWPVVESRGVRELTNLVRENWGGGRVLLLANGLIVKPLQQEEEVGQRALIGRFHGPILFERDGLPDFDLSNPGSVHPGDYWRGPTTTGLECVIQYDGSLQCNWYHPSRLGRDEVSERLHAPDNALAQGFRAARPGHSGGRVRLTANGHVITNRKQRDGTWACLYVGYVDASSWPFQEGWMGDWES